MKNIFKFAAMAFAAVAMFAACEPEDKGGEKFPTPDGKQWVWVESEEATWVLDFGVTAKSACYHGMLAGNTVNTMGGSEYIIIPTDETSGTIKITETSSYGEGEPVEYIFPYSDLTETSVKIDGGIAAMTLMGPWDEMVEFTLVTEPYNVSDPYAGMEQ